MKDPNTLFRVMEVTARRNKKHSKVIKTEIWD